jgi:hypothetical protein
MLRATNFINTFFLFPKESDKIKKCIFKSIEEALKQAGPFCQIDRNLCGEIASIYTEQVSQHRN